MGNQTNACDGCMFRGCQDRCKTCSRKYLDRYKPEPPPKQLTHEERIHAAQAITALVTIAEMGIKPYFPTK